jgi:hypothetical protein
MTFKVNDKVKPSPEFDFDMFSGPANKDSVGTIVALTEAAPEEGSYGLLLVDWDGEVNDHTTTEHTGFVSAADMEKDAVLARLIRGMSVVAAE